MSGHGMTASNRNLVESNGTRRVRWSVTMLLFAAASFWLGSGVPGTAHSEGETVPGEIRARKFVVVDDTGKDRAEFGIMESGEPGMVVWNKTKSAAVSVSIDRFGMPRIALENGKAEALLDFGILDDQYPVFVMRDASGRRRVAMVVAEDEEVLIELCDTKKRKRCALSLGKSGEPRIVLRDTQGKVRARLMLDDAGTSALDLLDRKERAHIVLQVDAAGQGDAAVFGPDGKAMWSAGRP